MNKIAIITTTRADWGLLRPIAHALQQQFGVQPVIFAGNSHLDPLRGNTVEEIINDGFSPVLLDAPDNFDDRGEVMTATVRSLSREIQLHRPDIVLLLGDRYEMMAAATIVAAEGIPIAHISGGEITEGALDDNFRHAISKLASLHFVTTEEHRNRVIQLGEIPEGVINVGAIGVSNVSMDAPMTREELEESLGFSLGQHPVIVTFHPATLDSVDSPIRFQALLDSLTQRPDLSPLFTFPNNDSDGCRLIAMINEYVEHHPQAHAIPSLGQRRYHSALHFAEMVIGNSSSGLVEVPSAGIPTVDIGCRQQRRTAGPSVIHAGDSTDEILKAIDLALSPEMKAIAARRENPYKGVDTVERIVKTLISVNPATLLPKHFCDL